jgi:hypothetical protein
VRWIAKRWVFGGGIALLLANSARAEAQVNTESLRKRIKERGFSLFVQGTFDGHTGNTRGLSADGLAGAGYAGGRHLAFAFGSTDYSRLNGVLGIEKSLAHARYNYELAPWLWWEAFVQGQSDVFQRIGLRSLAGTGPRFAPYEDKHLALFIGVAYMFERDVIDPATGEAGGQAQVILAHRTSTYFAAHATLNDGIDAVTTTYVQPRIDDPSDVRLLSESGFVFKVNRVFSTSITFAAHYDSNPPSGVLPTDAELKNALTLTL